MLPLPEGQTGKSLGTFRNECLFGNLGAFDREVLPVFAAFEGLKREATVLYDLR